ncbi:SHOCT domain-containing protein [Desulfitobacterium metallireducens]|uniref:SHOCT domain-containing protein n=1 Tax=Desulfitobacterium metallireducens DSM 15288 TaxID=871968 RepID=W0EG43_9FIRM|nr:SHOCT domain-containing protein [Desulfitobacterium metallireducens]AHF08493.1 hypothetical protein DESME_05160 [Desulfitobacterium metallireducens DSM 15288]
MMRYGLGTNHGYATGWASGGTIILIFLMVIVSIAVFSFSNDYFKKKNHPKHNKLLKILEDKYINEEISDDDYIERNSLLDDEYLLHSDNPAIMQLKEQYAKCEIDSREYIKRKKELSERRNQFALDILRERYAKGEISSEEFRKIKADIQYD